MLCAMRCPHRHSYRVKQPKANLRLSTHKSAHKSIQPVPGQARPGFPHPCILPSERLAYCTGLFRADTLRMCIRPKKNFVGTFVLKDEQSCSSLVARHHSKCSILASALERDTSAFIKPQVAIQSGLQSICSAQLPRPEKTDFFLTSQIRSMS